MGLRWGADCFEEFCSSVRKCGPELVIGTEKHKPTKQIQRKQKFELVKKQNHCICLFWTMFSHENINTEYWENKKLCYNCIEKIEGNKDYIRDVSSPCIVENP